MKKMYEESNIQDIANAIREKNGSTNTYKPSEMASAIREIEVGGSGLDVSKFGIQNEVTGTSIVTCDYVNENEHNVEVKLSSDTITDFSDKVVKVCGNNLFYKANENKATCDIPLPKGTTIIFSTEENWNSYVDLICVDGQVLAFDLKDVFNGRRYKTYTLTKDIAQIRFRDTAIEPQIATMFNIDYEPYTEQTYTPNADGTLEIESISPTMNIICEGVDISAKYYCVPSVEYDRFWDNYQDYGNRTDCKYMFYGQGWNDKTLKPKHRMKPKDMNYCFQYCGITDLTEVLSMFDTSECISFGYFVSNSNVEIMPKINVKSATTLNAILYYASKLRKIECIENVNKDQMLNNAFVVCSALEEIDFTGEIGKNISFLHSSKLTSKSAKNILQRLVNYFGTDEEYTYTVQLPIGVWGKLDAEGETSPTGTTWKKYVDDKGWLK